jgi:hypothetical protein
MMESAALVIEMLGFWALTQRNSQFPLQTLSSLLGRSGPVFNEVGKHIIELAS